MGHVYINEITGGTEGAAVEGMRAYIAGDNIPRSPIIPAQQTYVMALPTADSTAYLWMGDLWGSASDNVKGPRLSVLERAAGVCRRRYHHAAGVGG